MFNHWQWQRLSQEREYIISTVDPSIMIIQQIVTKVERTHAMLGRDDYARTLLWDNDIIPLKDSLEDYAKEWHSRESILTLNRFSGTIDYLKEQESDIVQNNKEVPNANDFLADLRFAANRLVNDQLLVYKNGKLNDGRILIRRMNWIIVISFLFAVILASALGSRIIISILNKIRRVKHYIKEVSEGKLPPAMNETNDELNSIIKSVNNLVLNLRQITDFAHEVGKGNFESEITVFNNEGSLGESLADMRESLQNVAEDDKKRRWFNEGITEFADLMRHTHNDLDELADAIIRKLVQYLGATQGALFIVNDSDPNDVHLEMRGLYAYERKKYLNKKIQPGQGLAGQAFREKEKIVLKEIPQNYTEVASGLGDATPDFLVIMPLKSNESIFGVIEIASFKALEQHEIDFFEKAAENMAAAIASVKTSQETERLLEESQMATEQLRAQEEEMRQNAEELQATQEEIHRQMREASEQRDMFISLMENVEGVIYRSKYDETWTKLYVSENVEEMTGYMQSAFVEQGKSFGEIIHPEDLTLVNQTTEEALRDKQKWNLEYRMVKRDSSIIWVQEKGKGVYDSDGRVKYIDGIILDITDRVNQEKTKSAASV